MHDFLFLPRSHKEVGRNRLPGPGEYCISLYVAAVCYANAPCRRNETRNGMPFRDLPYLPSPIPRSLSVQLASNHLPCRSLESRSARMHSSYTSGLAIRENWGPTEFSVTQWFPIVMPITKANSPRQTNHSRKKQRDRIRNLDSLSLFPSLSLSLSGNDSTMESLQEVLIITALKLTLLQSCSLGSYNSSA